MDRIEVGESLDPEAARRLTQTAATAIDMGEQKTGEHEEGAGGEEAHAGDFVQQGNGLALGIEMDGVVDDHIETHQEPEPLQTNEAMFI